MDQTFGEVDAVAAGEEKVSGKVEAMTFSHREMEEDGSNHRGSEAAVGLDGKV